MPISDEDISKRMNQTVILLNYAADKPEQNCTV